MSTRSVPSSRFLVINNPGSLLFNASNAKATATMDFTRSAGQSFSVGCWFKRIGKPIDANGFTLIGVRNGSGAGDLWKLGILQNLTLTFNYDTTGGGEAINSDMSTDSSWHHLVGTYDGASLKLYLDGVLIKTGTSKTTAAIDQTNFALGTRADTEIEDFVGLTKECFVSTYALSLSEIKNIYYKNIYDLTRITHLWKLNDASGTSAVDTKGTLNLTISAATWNTNIPGHMAVRSAIGTGSPLSHSQSNYIPNPSFETNTTGWSVGAGATITRITNDSIIGTCCMKITTNGADGYGSKRTSAIVTIPAENKGKRCVISFYAKAGTLNTMSIEHSALVTASANFNITSSWVRYTYTSLISSTGSTSFFFYAGTRGAIGPAGDIYVDGAMIEIFDPEISSSNYPSNYIDGAQTNCSWLGTAHNSKSIRTTSPEVRYFAGTRTAI